MKFVLVCKLIGLEERISKKTGEIYYLGLFVQGVSTMNFMIDRENYLKLELYKDYDLKVEYNTNYKTFKLLDIE